MSIQLDDNSPLIPAAQALQTAQDSIISLNSQVADLTNQVKILTVSPRNRMVEDILTVGKSWGFLGIPYVFGAEYQNNRAFDCSSFTQELYANFGVKLPRTSYDQFTVGTLVDWHSLWPGDLLFYKIGTSIHPTTHVGISSGPGQMLHINTPAQSIHLEDITKGGWAGWFVGARRVM